MQPHLSVLFPTYLSESPLTFAVQREGEEKVSTISWNQSEQIVWQDCSALRHPSPFAVRAMTLLPWPLYPCNAHKNPPLLISRSYLPLTSPVSSRSESNLKKNPRPVSVCLSSIKGKPNPRQSKRRISCFKNNSHFQRGTTADIQTR